MTKALKIILIIIFTGIVGIAVLIFKVIPSIFEKKDVVKLYNKSKDEEIYLMRLSWGIDDTKMTIGLDENLNSCWSNSEPDKYETNSSNDTWFFYKLTDDTLFVYGPVFSKPKFYKFKTFVKIIELHNGDFITMGENKKYKTFGLDIFPPIEIERLDYADKLEKKHK